MEKIFRAIIIVAIVSLSLLTAVTAQDASPSPTVTGPSATASPDIQPATKGSQASMLGRLANPPMNNETVQRPSRGRDNPFAPSALMQAMAARKKQSPADLINGTSDVMAAAGLPNLQAIMVRDGKVLAYFVMGNSAFVAEPGNVLGASGMVFVAYENDVAVLRDSSGKTHYVRLAFKPAVTKQTSATPSPQD